MSGVTVVSDPGVDDIIALALLDVLEAREQKLLIATFGNNNLEVVKRNAKEFVGFIQNGWTWRPGAALPLNGKVEYPWADYFHGSDGVWGVRPPKSSARAIRSDRTADSQVISLGPLTEPWRLLRSGATKQLTVMGGAFNEKGNETAYAEVNVAFDADAARALFDNCGGVDVRVVPLDVSRKTTWSLEQVRTVPETSVRNVWLKNLLLAWFEGYNHEKEDDFNLADPLAVFLAYYPDAADWTRSGVEVIDLGKRRGQTKLSATNPPCDVALSLKDPEATAQKIYKLLFLGDKP